jgi:hypothetical protein
MAMTSPESNNSLVKATIGELIEQRKPKNVTEFLEAFHSPVGKLGLALHTEFSGINLRGVITHNVQIRHSGSQDHFPERNDMFSRKDQILILADLKSEELEEKGQVLSLFLNELDLCPNEIEKGLIRLENTQEDIPKSDCPFSVGIIPTEEAIRLGKSGFIVSSSGEFQIFPKIKEKMGVKEFRSELEKKNYNLFLELRNISIGEIKHPLIERLITESAFLIGKAIADRKVKSEFV